jgi:hypothetical protein
MYFLLFWIFGSLFTFVSMGRGIVNGWRGFGEREDDIGIGTCLGGALYNLPFLLSFLEILSFVGDDGAGYVRKHY